MLLFFYFNKIYFFKFIFRYCYLNLALKLLKLWNIDLLWNETRVGYRKQRNERWQTGRNVISVVKTPVKFPPFLISFFICAAHNVIAKANETM